MKRTAFIFTTFGFVFSDFCAKLAKRFLGEVMPKCSVYNSPSKLGTTFSCRLGILKMKKQTAKTFQRKKWFSVRFGKQRKQAWRLTARWWWWLLVVDKFAADEKEGTEKELGFGRFCFFPVQKRLWKKLFFLSRFVRHLAKIFADDIDIDVDVNVVIDVVRWSNQQSFRYWISIFPSFFVTFSFFLPFFPFFVILR